MGLRNTATAMLAALLLGAASGMGQRPGGPGAGLVFSTPKISGGRGRSKRRRLKGSREALVRTKAGGVMQAWKVKKRRNQKVGASR